MFFSQTGCSISVYLSFAYDPTAKRQEVIKERAEAKQAETDKFLVWAGRDKDGKAADPTKDPFYKISKQLATTKMRGHNFIRINMELYRAIAYRSSARVAMSSRSDHRHSSKIIHCSLDNSDEAGSNTVTLQ